MAGKWYDYGKWYYDYKPRSVLRQNWQKRLALAVSIFPVVSLLLIGNYTEHRHRNQLLTKIFNSWNTPENFRSQIRRVWEDKIPCGQIPFIAGMKEEEMQPFIDECEAVASRLAELENHPK